MSNTEISLLDVDVYTLRQKQFEALKKHIINVLREAAKIVTEEKFDLVDKMIFNSPAGDDMGCDNHCIDFGFNGKELDFYEVIDILQTMKKEISASQENDRRK